MDISGGMSAGADIYESMAEGVSCVNALRRGGFCLRV